MGNSIPFAGLSEVEFNRQVAGLRGKVPLVSTSKRKRDATPEEWAAHLDYTANYNALPVVKEAVASRRRAFHEKNRERLLKQKAAYRASRREELAAKQRQYNRENLEERRAYAREYQRNNQRPEYQRQWKSQNKEKMRQYFTERARKKREQDPLFRLTCAARSAVKSILKRRSLVKTSKTFEMVGCTGFELAEFLEKQFVEGMSWDSYGKDGWHVDHIIPISLAKTEAHVRILSRHENLRPLNGPENLRKKAVVCRDLITPVLRKLVPVFGTEPFKEMLEGVELL